GPPVSRRERNLAVTLLALVLASGAGVLWSNPRHRAFYFGRRAGPPPASGLGDSAGAPAVSPVAALIPGRRVPLPDAAGRIVVRRPAAGDVRHAATDDEAAQVYVIFPRWPAPFTNSDVIGYVWDSRAPVGTQLTSPKAANVRVVVVESGTSRLGAWQRQERNVAADYAALFGRQPPRVGQVAVMIDSDDTRGDAGALFGDLVFSRGTTERTEIPTSMLR